MGERIVTPVPDPVEQNREQGLFAFNCIIYLELEGLYFNGFNWGKDNDQQNRFMEWIRKEDPEIVALIDLSKK